MATIAVPLSADAATPLKKAAKVVRHDLSLVKPCRQSLITSLSSTCFDIFQEYLLHGFTRLTAWISPGNNELICGENRHNQR